MLGLVLAVEATAVNQIHRESCLRGADVLECWAHEGDTDNHKIIKLGTSLVVSGESCLLPMLQGHKFDPKPRSHML